MRKEKIFDVDKEILKIEEKFLDLLILTSH